MSKRTSVVAVLPTNSGASSGVWSVADVRKNGANTHYTMRNGDRVLTLTRLSEHEFMTWGDDSLVADEDIHAAIRVAAKHR